MNCWLLVLHLMLLLDSVLSSLPAPVNVSVSSVNFNHVLHWDPGPGTPPGTQYKIWKRLYGRQNKRVQNSTTTSFKLKLNHSKKYYLTVQASCNQTLSPESREVAFLPFRDTKIGPPKLSLAGCGSCIQINITLPEADKSSGIDDIQKFYGAEFKVFWRKRNEAKVSRKTENRSFTLDNLENATEYCVWAHTQIYLNKNTEPSARYCTFTSILEPSRGPVVLGTVAALVIFIFVLMTSMFGLYYTGFLKATKPTALIVALSQGYTLTPERTVPDQICIRSEIHNNHTMPQPATRGTYSEEEDESEDEEEQSINVYMDRGVELASGESSCQNSSVSGICGSLTVEVLDAEFEVEVAHAGFEQDEAKAEGAEVSFMPDEGQTGVQRHFTGEVKEEVYDSSANINLFSVTLAALAVCEAEDEEDQSTRDSLTDFSNLSNLEPVLPTNSNRTLSHTDSQTE